MTDEKLNNSTPWQDLTIGGNIYEAGNAKEFKTGDWRSQKPIWIEEKCKQCGLCIPVSKDQKRKDFNYDACKGCMVCVKVCPFKAIEKEV